jgi:hypothetical protein
MNNKLLFSHVWEDPICESTIVDSLNNESDINKILMVCSGGDTLIHLLCKNNDDIVNKNIVIDVIDSNKLQIALCVLKILVLHGLNNDFDFNGVFDEDTNNELAIYNIIMYGGVTIDYNKLIDILIIKYNYLPYAKFLNVWKEDDNMELLNNGVLYCGELEKTFYNCFNSNARFEDNFNDVVLTLKFGSSAINLSPNNGFINKFKSIHSQYILKHGIKYNVNKFYYRMVHGHDDNNIIHQIINDFADVTDDILKRLNFIHNDIQSYVVTSKNKYDIIQVSNITDWLNARDNVEKFIRNVYKVCKYNGSMLWRSLNGEYGLINILEKYSDQNINSVNDSSYFYKSVYVTKKELNVTTLLLDVDEYVNVKNMLIHPYFLRLYNKTFTLEEFYKTQIPFCHAVKHWVEVLVKVSEKFKLINEHKMSDLLYNNINDELGIDHDNITHVNTFQAFLHAISDNKHIIGSEAFEDKSSATSEAFEDKSSATSEAFEDKPSATSEAFEDKPSATSEAFEDKPSATSEAVSPAVNKFNTDLDYIIEHKSLCYVCAYLGTIEYQYILVSTMIKEFVDEHKIDQPHYNMHEIMDIVHSSDLYQMSIYFCNNNINDLYDGIKDGYINFMQLYTEMLIF